MIKSLQRAMLRAEGVLQSAIKRHMYMELQQFVQLILREPLRRSVRKKHDTIKVLVFFLNLVAHLEKPSKHFFA